MVKIKYSIDILTVNIPEYIYMYVYIQTLKGKF